MIGDIILLQNKYALSFFMKNRYLDYLLHLMSNRCFLRLRGLILELNYKCQEA